MTQKVTNAKRDPGSNAVVFTDTRGYAAAKIRKQRANKILSNEQEVNNLRDQVAKLSELVERLLDRG